MKKIITSLVIAFIVIPSTYASTITFAGQITEISYQGDITVPDSIVAGLNYTATIDYDPSLLLDIQSDAWALYFNNYNVAMHVEFDDGHFIDSVYSTSVSNNYNGYDELKIYKAPDLYSTFTLTRK